MATGRQQRRPQWRGERTAVLVRVPTEVAEQLRLAASSQQRSVSEHAAEILERALRTDAA